MARRVDGGSVVGVGLGCFVDIVERLVGLKSRGSLGFELVRSISQ